MSWSVLAQSEPFGEQVVVAATGPLVTVLVGGLLVWSITTSIQRRRENEDRKQADLRDDRIRSQDIARADDTLRQELITAMTEAAGTLYLGEQQYWRQRGEAQDEQALRAALDAQYIKSRAAGEVLENRLDGYFVSEEPRRAWHSAMDLLTVRYFQLCDRDTDALYRANAGADHSGLTADQLRDTGLLLATYRQTLKTSVRAVFDNELRERS